MAGKVVHFTIPIDEPDRAISFYRSVFGWRVSQWGPVDYWSVESDPGEGIDGGLTLRSQEDPTAVVYVDVPSLAEAVDRVVAAGGRVAAGRMPIPGTGWIARIVDTEGNVLGIFQADATAGLSR